MSYLQLQPLTSTIPSSAVFLINSIYYPLANYILFFNVVYCSVPPYRAVAPRGQGLQSLLFKMKVNQSLAGVLHKVRIQ